MRKIWAMALMVLIALMTGCGGEESSSNNKLSVMLQSNIVSLNGEPG